MKNPTFQANLKKLAAAAFLAGGVGVSVATLSALSMPTAQAVPECANINLSTTLCQRPGGSAQLDTAPNPAAAVRTLQWPWWGPQVVVGR